MLIDRYREEYKSPSFFLVSAFLIFVFFPNMTFGVVFNNALLVMMVGFTYVLLFINQPNFRHEVPIIFAIVMLLLFKYYYYSTDIHSRVSDAVRFLFYITSFFVFTRLYKDSVTFNQCVVWVLLAQVVIVFFQMNDFSLISTLYNAEKVGHETSTYTQFRFTGSLFNPNTLGVFFVFCVSLCISWKSRFSYYSLLLLLLFVSGSRTSFLMALVAMFIYELSCEFSLIRILKFIFFCSLFSVIFLSFLNIYSEEFYYFSQMSQVVQSALVGDVYDAFSQVSSLTARLELWSELISDFVSGGYVTWLIGLPDITSYRYGDNSYVYILTKFGLINGSVFLCFLLVIYYKIFAQCENKEQFCRTNFWLSFSLLSGLFSDVLVSYYYWIMLILFPILVMKNEEI